MTIAPQTAPSVKSQRLERAAADRTDASVERPAGAVARMVGERRWAINGDFLTLRPTGVARYANEVTRALSELIVEGHPLTAGLDIEIIVPRYPRERFAAIPSRLVPEFSTPRLPQFWVQAQLPRHVKGGLLSFCNLAPVAVSRQIVCIHDLHTRLTPESYGRLFRLAHRVVLPALGRRVARIATVSEFSRRQLADFGVAPREKTFVTYNGADHAKRWDPAEGKLKVEPRRPFALTLGRAETHKNLRLLLDLAPALDRIGIDLWVAGDVDRSILGERAQLPNVRMLGRVGDDDLARLFTKALCFLFPSRIEGFGLPAVEAMVWGCPVVAADAPCLPEICGDAALYADPDDGAGWLAAIERLSIDVVLRRRMETLGRARAERYSWRAIAESYLLAMAEIDAADAKKHKLEEAR